MELLPDTKIKEVIEPEPEPKEEIVEPVPKENPFVESPKNVKIDENVKDIHYFLKTIIVIKWIKYFWLFFWFFYILQHTCHNILSNSERLISRINFRSS